MTGGERKVVRELQDFCKIFHIPADFVVYQWTFDGEGSSNCVFLCLHDVWPMLRRQIRAKIIQQYQGLGILPRNPVESEKSALSPLPGGREVQERLPGDSQVAPAADSAYASRHHEEPSLW